MLLLFFICSIGSITSAALMMSDAQAGQGMQGPGPGPGQVPVRRPHDPRMRGADPRQQAHPRPAQPIQQPQPNPQPQPAPAANLPAEQQKGNFLLILMFAGAAVALSTACNVGSFRQMMCHVLLACDVACYCLHEVLHMASHSALSWGEETLTPCVWYAVLLNQIMQLSPAQIDGLPHEQKAQVLALQQQMVSLLLIHEYCVGPVLRPCLLSSATCIQSIAGSSTSVVSVHWFQFA